jgi:hypothetical protein
VGHEVALSEPAPDLSVHTGVGFYGKYVADRGSSNVHLSGFAIEGDVRERIDTDQVNGVGGALSDSTVDGLYIRHTKVGMWFDGPMTNLRLTNNIIVDQIADGLNFHSGVTGSVVRGNFVRNSGDDGLAMWSETTADTGNVFDHNTVQTPTLANGIAIYGGEDNTVSGNLIADPLREGSGIQVGSRFGAQPFTGHLWITDNTTARAGTYELNWNIGLGAIWLYALERSIDADIQVAGDHFLDNTYNAIMLVSDFPVKDLYSITNVHFKDITAAGPPGRGWRPGSCRTPSPVTIGRQSSCRRRRLLGDGRRGGLDHRGHLVEGFGQGGHERLWAPVPRRDDADVAGRSRRLQRDGGHRVLGDGERHMRDQAHADAGRDKRLGEHVIGPLAGDLHLEAGQRRVVMEQVVGGEAALHPALAGKLGERQRLALGQPVTARQHDPHRIIEQRRPGQAGPVTGTDRRRSVEVVRQGHVGGARPDLGQALLRFALQDGQLDSGIVRGKPGQRLREQALAAAGEGGDGQPVGLAPDELVDLLAGVAQLSGDRLRRLHQHPAGACHLDAAGGPLHDRRTQRPFQRADLLRHGRGCEPQHVCRLPEAPLPGHFTQHMQALDVDHQFSLTRHEQVTTSAEHRIPAGLPL